MSLVINKNKLCKYSSEELTQQAEKFKKTGIDSTY